MRFKDSRSFWLQCFFQRGGDTLQSLTFLHSGFLSQRFFDFGVSAFSTLVGTGMEG